MEAGALRAPAALNRISVTAPLLRLRSDEQLVALFRAGNDAAFSVIHDRYRQRLFAYSRQMLGGSRQDAEDALQDVFLRAYSSLRCNDRPLSLRAWLYRVAHNRCIDHLRRPAPPSADLYDTSRKPLHDPMDEAVRREDLRQLVEDVRRLPEQQRSALLMREMDGLSYAELAEALGVSLPAVKSLLVRARIGLVEAVEARDTACSEIRLGLADSFDRGVRASGLARRHLRDCEGCSEYRTQLRAVRHGLNVLLPGGSGPLTAALKLIGLGGAGSAGAASAGGAGAAGSGVLAAATTGTAAKVAAVVCCAALTATSAVEVRERIVHSSGPAAAAKRDAAAPLSQGTIAPALRQARVAAAAAAAAAAAPLRHSDVATATAATVSTTGRHTRSAVAQGTASGTDPAAASTPSVDTTTGGAAAPLEDEGAAAPLQQADPPATSSPTPATEAASGSDQDAVAKTTLGDATGEGAAASGATGAGAESASGSIPPG
jgi:RNA polymerase sigma factor (sigma-70 family)